MNTNHRLGVLAAAGALAFAIGSAGAQQPQELRSPEEAAAAAGVALPAQDDRYQLGGVVGKTDQDRPYVMGGASIEEAFSLEAVRDDYRLWLVTADQASGAWLAGARTTIRDAGGNEVLQTTLDGPYLLVDLAPGRYTVETELDGQRKTHTVSIGRQGTRQVIAYFDTQAARSPEMPDRRIAPVDAEPLVEVTGAAAR